MDGLVAGRDAKHSQVFPLRTRTGVALIAAAFVPSGRSVGRSASGSRPPRQWIRRARPDDRHLTAVRHEDQGAPYGTHAPTTDSANRRACWTGRGRHRRKLRHRVGFFDGLPTPFDHVFVTGGGPIHVPIADLDFEQALRVLDEHLVGALRITRTCAPHIRRGGSMTLSTGTDARRPGVSSCVASERDRGWIRRHATVGTDLGGRLESATR